MDKSLLMGRLVRNPEVRYSQNASNSAIARFSMAVPRKFKKEGEPDSDFFNCVCFGKVAEFVEKYIKKGNKIIVTGRTENNIYTNKDGQMVYGMKVVVEEIEFAESKYIDAKESQEKNDTPETTEADNGYMNIPDGIDEQLPFN